MSQSPSVDPPVDLSTGRDVTSQQEQRVSNRGSRLELTWPGKDQSLVPRDESGKPIWVERDHPAASEMTDSLSISKRDAAPQWIAPEKWGYRLSSEAVIASASTLEALRNGGQGYQ